MRLGLHRTPLMLSLIVSVAFATVAVTPPASAADLVRAGKSSPGSFSFIPLDVGAQAGIFKKHGIDLQIIGFSGGTKMHQALAADTIDVAFGSGPQMVLTAKGAPMMAVAEMAGPPINFAVIVPYDSPAKTLDDLKGKKIGVSGKTSLSSFMADEIALTKGWGPQGIELVVIGGMHSGIVSALRTHQVDAGTFDLRVGLQLEKLKEGRVLAPCSDYIRNFVTHVIYAQNNIIKNKPDVLKRFLASWFETIEYMKKNKETTVKVAAKITGAPEDLESREYDLLMPAFFSTTGHFKPEDVAVVGQSLKLMRSMTNLPDMSKLYTEQFLPK